MTKNDFMLRPGLTAIAAVLALSTTPLHAQEADPVADTTVTTTASTPEPTAEPVSSETTTSDPLAPTEVAPVATTAAEEPARTAPSAARSAPRAPTVVTRSARAAESVAATPAPAPTAPATATPVEPLPSELAAAPMTPDVAPVAAPTDSLVESGDMVPIAGAAGLGILALAGAGMALRRRRRDETLVEQDDLAPVAEPRIARPVTPAPVATPVAPVASDRSAFGWGAAAATAAPAAARDGSHVEAAYRGPTPDNPFLSLKKRLRRAAFFDQRERAVRAGKASPVSLAAGLPKALAARVRPQSGQRSFSPQFA